MKFVHIISSTVNDQCFASAARDFYDSFLLKDISSEHETISNDRRLKSSSEFSEYQNLYLNLCDRIYFYSNNIEIKLGPK